VSHKKVNKSQY